MRLFRSGRRILFLLVHRFVSKSGFTCSCAWRHCGAEADAQEALAELNNLSGVLEPFECEFIIDIVDRSLRDMIAVIPQKYLIQERVAMYQPYESKVGKFAMLLLHSINGICLTSCSYRHSEHYGQY